VVKKKTFYSLVILGLLLASVITVLAGATYFQGTDNENNAGGGIADNDMDVRLCEPNSLLPIEFNINVPTAPQPGENTKLVIYANDVDEEQGEFDQVYLNDAAQTSPVGSLSGTDGTWSMTSLDVTGSVITGNNRIDITVNTGWCVEVDWGQIVVDSGEQDKGRISDLSASGDWDNIQVATVVTSSVTSTFGIDVNLLNASRENKDVVTDTFSMAGDETITRTHSLSTQVQPSAGEVFTIEVILYDQSTYFIHHIREITWTYTEAEADLSISKSAEQRFTEATFTIVAQNLGPDAANGAVVSDTLAATSFLSVTWTCSAAGGAACGAANGTGDIQDTLGAFPSGGVVTYTVQCTLVDWSVYENVAEISVPSGVSDPDTSNNRVVCKRYQLLFPVIYRNWTR